jgi:hypothetical protein
MFQVIVEHDILPANKLNWDFASSNSLPSRVKGKFENIKGVIRSRKLKKDWQYNGQKKNYKDKTIV